MTIFLTGANGFVGSYLCKAFVQSGYSVRGVVRKISSTLFTHPYIEYQEINDLAQVMDWSHLLKDIDIIIHTAARVHQMKETDIDPIGSYRKMNTQTTLNLLEAAIKARVKKFIFISTIKVNGEETFEKPFIENDSVQPSDPYALSKWEAEEGISKMIQGSSIRYTIVRLPLVYGPGVKANFASLIRLVKKGLPLPFAAIPNKRSFLYIGNLTSAIMAILNSSASHNQTYLLSDNEDLSTAELCQQIAIAYGIKSRLLPIPLFLFHLLGKLTGKQKAISRLLGSLQIDSSKIRSELNWQPPYSLQAGLIEMAKQDK